MNPVRASLRYPQVAITIAGILFLAGLYALFTMPRREDPKITIHAGIVSAAYPGATAEQVEDQVTQKIEQRLFRFEEVRRERTYSTTRNGVVVIHVELNKEFKDTDRFWSKLRLEMAQLKATELPAGVRGPAVDSDFGDTVAMLIAVHGSSYGPRELKDYAQRVEDALRVIPAVSKIKRIGDQEEEIDISTSSERLAQYGVTTQKMMQAFAGRNTVAYAGRVPAEQNKVPVEIDGTYKTENEVRRTMVDISPSGQPVYVDDFAEVKRVYKDPSQYVRINGAPAILLSVEVHDGYNIVDAGQALRKTLKALEGSLPPDVKLDLVADQPGVVSQRILDFFREFGIAIVAVILVTMLLLPLRTALVSAIAIPVTVSITFAALDALGIELQQVSISSLIVVLGMVVDDAIVIADNYMELLDRKMSVEEASWKCATQMAVPVLTATLTIIGSFLPILFLVTGPMGEFIGSLPVAVAVSLGTSFVVAMLLTPLAAHTFIKKGLTHPEFEEAGGAHKLALLDYMQTVYNRTIVWAMERKQQVLIGGVIAVIAGVGILAMVPKLLFPLAERNQFVMDIWLPEGSRIEATDTAVGRIEATLHREPLVASYTGFLGGSAPRFYYNVNPEEPASNYAQIVVNTRAVKGTPELVAALREKLAQSAPEAKVLVKQLQQGQPMEAPIEIRVVGPDATILNTLGNNIEEILRHTQGATYIHTDWHEDAWQMGVKVRQEEANRLGLTSAAIAQQLAGGFEGAPLTTYWEGDRGVDLVLRIDPTDRQSFDDLAETYVTSPVTGAKVPLEAVASLAPEWQPGRIVRRNGVRTLTVRAFPDGTMLASDVLARARKQVERLQLPSGYRIEYGGELQNEIETYSELQLALMASLVLIFLVLLLQFRTLSDPLIVMMAFPLALPGAALGLFVTHNTFGFTAFVGIVSLGGLAVRNSIILIDYVHERMKQGIGLEQAALEAGERRLRPIFLTTMAAAVGVTPMILSGSSLWSPMASAIAFGLVGSMFSTLVVIPVLFVVAHTPGGWRTLFAGMKKRSAATVGTALLMGAIVTGAARGETKKLTLAEAVDLAHKQNPTVKLAVLRTREMDARLSQARANYFPVVANTSLATHLGDKAQLTLPMGALGIYPVAGPIPGTTVQVPLGNQDSIVASTTAEQPITQMFKIHAGVRVASAEARLARDDAKRAQDEVTLNVKRLYYQLLVSEKQKQAAELEIAAGEARLTEARNAVDAGAVLELKALEGRAQVAEAKHQLETLKDGIGDMEAELNDLMGLPPETDLELAVPEEERDDERTDLVMLALKQSPDVASARDAVAKAKAGLAAARAEYIPGIGGYADYLYQNGAPLMSHNNGAVGVKVDWTLVEFGKRAATVRERKAQVAEAEENLIHVESRVRIETEKQARRLRRADSGLAAAREALAARKEMRRITADQVEAKTANKSALMEAEAGQAAAEATMLQAEMEKDTARAELVRTLGEE